MEVSQQDDHITHAVIGRHQAQSMGVSDSAALMHILSSALYTHPKLATVREPMCNAWDAHITAGKTDVPIEISLVNNLLTIQDFGPGIPDEKIVPIYGIYGDSTKREDSDVTGGFGLGSKAPFAYVDNFEVTSCHAGVKTIYRMTKSSMEKGGRPSIVQIVSMPTDETGVKVVINIQDRDVNDFKTVINEVIALGEIKANFNGELVPVLPLLESPTGYIINSFTGTLTNRINIRYGNVTYPIPKSETYLEEWMVVNDGLRTLWDRANIIFYAEPNSISIAPSREALILTEGTVATIKQLLVKFRMEDLADGILVRRVKNAEHLNKVINKEPPLEAINLLGMVPDLPRSSEWQGENHWSGAFAYTVRKASVAYAMINNHESYSREDVMIKRLHKMLREAKGKDGDSSKVKFIRDIIKCHRTAPNDTRARDNRRYNYTPGTTTVLHRHVIKPLRELIGSGSHLTMDRLSFYSANYDWRTGEHMTTVRSLRAGGLGCLSAFLGRRVLIAPNKTAITNHFRHMRYNTDDSHGWIVYTCPAHLKSREAVDKAFRDAGYVVTNVMPEPKVKEVDPNFVPAPRKKAGPKRKGYLTLRASLWDKMFLLATARASKLPEVLDNPLSVWYFIMAALAIKCRPHNI